MVSFGALQEWGPPGMAVVVLVEEGRTWNDCMNEMVGSFIHIVSCPG